WGRGDGGIRGRPGRPDGSRRGRLGGDAVQTRRVVVTRDSGWVAAVLIALLLAGPIRAEQTATPSSGDSESNTDLAKKTQNPVADLISVPFQNNFNFNTGQEKRSVWVLNIQPVVPIKLTDDWTLTTRTIVPTINQPPLAPGVDQATGGWATSTRASSSRRPARRSSSGGSARHSRSPRRATGCSAWASGAWG